MNALDLAEAIMERCRLVERLELDEEQADVEKHEIADEIMAWLRSR